MEIGGERVRKFPIHPRQSQSP